MSTGALRVATISKASWLTPSAAGRGTGLASFFNLRVHPHLNSTAWPQRRQMVRGPCDTTNHTRTQPGRCGRLRAPRHRIGYLTGGCQTENRPPYLTVVANRPRKEISTSIPPYSRSSPHPPQPPSSAAQLCHSSSATGSVPRRRAGSRQVPPAAQPGDVKQNRTAGFMAFLPPTPPPPGLRGGRSHGGKAVVTQSESPVVVLHNCCRSTPLLPIHNVVKPQPARAESCSLVLHAAPLPFWSQTSAAAMAAIALRDSTGSGAARYLQFWDWPSGRGWVGWVGARQQHTHASVCALLGTVR